MNEIRFYRSTGKYGFMSNLYPAEIVYNGLVFPSAEHLYQWRKTSNQKIKEWIRLAPFPRCAAIAGHGLFQYDVVEGWTRMKIGVMREALDLKFSQHPGLAAKLLATGEAVLIEESNTDPFWGIGRNGTGLNTLGGLLMVIRDKINNGGK